MLRPGRTIELIQAELVSGGRTAVRATAWRLQKSDSSTIAGLEDERMPGPDELVEPAILTEWPGGYIQSIEVRQVTGHRPGHGRAWLRTKHPLVDGEAFTAASRLIGLIDTSNGIATRVKPGPGSYAFPNVPHGVPHANVHSLFLALRKAARSSATLRLLPRAPRE